VRLTDEILSTFLCEVENIINSRPLTKMNSDIHDPTPITPNDLLLLRGKSVAPPGKFVESDRYRKRWRHVQFLCDQFWRKWVKLYLPELQRRCKWTNAVENLKTGDLVLIMDESIPRNLWPLALVTEAVRGRDGLVRSAKVKTRSSHFVRPISKLVCLESTAMD
jgi:hypothetical protein